MSRRVLVGIATIPERHRSMVKVLDSLSRQADEIVLSLNGYKEIPPSIRKYTNVVPLLQRSGGNGDAEKFAAVDDWEGYVLTCDDDILYPRDYVRTLVAGIERYERKAIVGFHGGTTLGWNGSAVAASHKRIQCLGELPADDPEVNVLGTGVLGWHTDRIPVWRDIFRYANMADVQMCCHARLFGIPFVALAHKRGWLKDICPSLAVSPRIHYSNKHKDGSIRDTHDLRAQEIRRFDWLTPPPPRPTVRVSITTCKRPHKLMELLIDLEREARWVDLEVMVFEDPSPKFDYTPVKAFAREQGWLWYRHHTHLGRMGYWQLVNHQMRACQKSRAEWFLFLPDDVRLVRHAIPRAITTWQFIDNPTTLTLWRLQSLENKSNWTGVKPVNYGDVSEVFHVDGLYLCKREMLTTIGFRCATTSSTSRTQTSSGVGSWMSRVLHKEGKRMYRVEKSLVISNDDGISIMNPDERALNPAVTL